LTLRAADILLDAIAEGRAREIADVLVKAKPVMASLLNIAQAATDAYDPRQAREQVERFRDSLQSAPVEAGRAAADLVRALRDRCRIVTISASSAVEETIKDLCRTTSLTGLIIGESRPRMEGRVMALRLQRFFKAVRFTYDALLPGLLRPDSVVLIGADAVTDGAVYNKAGSLMLATVATMWDLPVLAVTTSHKVVPPYLRHRFAEGERAMVARAEERASKEDDPLFDLLFEAVSRDLLTAVVTENGLLPGPVRKQ